MQVCELVAVDHTLWKLCQVHALTKWLQTGTRRHLFLNRRQHERSDEASLHCRHHKTLQPEYICVLSTTLYIYTYCTVCRSSLSSHQNQHHGWRESSKRWPVGAAKQEQTFFHWSATHCMLCSPLVSWNCDQSFKLSKGFMFYWASARVYWAFDLNYGLMTSNLAEINWPRNTKYPLQLRHVQNTTRQSTAHQ